MSQPIECCESECTTEFCPHCGKKSPTPINNLLGHVRRSAKQRRECARIIKNRSQIEPEESTYWNKRQEDYDRLAEKWTSWEEALESLILQTSNKQ